MHSTVPFLQLPIPQARERKRHASRESRLFALHNTTHHTPYSIQHSAGHCRQHSNDTLLATRPLSVHPSHAMAKDKNKEQPAHDDDEIRSDNSEFEVESIVGHKVRLDYRISSPHAAPC